MWSTVTKFAADGWDTNAGMEGTTMLAKVLIQYYYSCTVPLEQYLLATEQREPLDNCSWTCL